MTTTTRRLIVILAIVLMILAMMPLAFAHDAGPCNDVEGPGNSSYAQHHILPATPGHVPGAHGGFSLCLGTGRVAHQP
jgi:hypothetical protein